MIAITTENNTLRIAAEIPIPNGQNWSPGRIQRLMMEIERYVFTAELVDKDLPQSNGTSALRSALHSRQSALQSLSMSNESTERVFCGDRERGCGASLTSADLEAGRCTQCGEPLVPEVFPLEHALLLSLSEVESRRAT